MLRDLYRFSKTTQSLAPAVRTAAATTTGTGVAWQDCRAALVLVIAGTVTDGTHTIAVEHSDDNSAWSDASANLSSAPPALTSANANTVTEMAYRGVKPYLRVKVTVAGATSGGIVAGYVLRADPYQGPLR